MHNNLCYLSGPISGESYARATDWRDKFKQNILANTGGKVKCLSPMRGKHYLENVQELDAVAAEGVLSGGPSILAGDYADVMNADIIVVNLLGAKRVSIGSVLEIAFAYTKHTPVVLVIEDGVENIHTHLMLFAMCGFKVNNLEDAETIVETFFDV